MANGQSKLIILGFGSQAKAWALNLADSKRDVTIALKQNSPNRELALKMGFHVKNLGESLKEFMIVVMLIPDDQHFSFLNEHHSTLNEKVHLVYAHGFSLSKFDLRKNFPQFIHSLLAPKAIASEVRFQYETKGKIGAALDIGHSSVELEIKKLANDVGFNALYNCTFDQETKADLFSEQSLLCSILPYVSLKSYNILRKNGIPKEIAFMECFLELKSISQAFVTMGPEAFFKLISPNALLGSQKGRHALLGIEFDKSLEKLMEDIESKKFYNEVETDIEVIRKQVLTEWKAEELNETYLKIKNELI